MKCLRCNAENAENINYCLDCGAPLRFRRKTDLYQKRKIMAVLLVLCGWAFAFSYFFRDTLFVAPEEVSSSSATEDPALKEKRQALRRELSEKMKAVQGEAAPAPEQKAAQASASAAAAPATGTPNAAPATPAPSAAEERTVLTGWVSVYDSWNRELARLRVAAATHGWLALPSRALLGGSRVQFRSDNGHEYFLESGLWAMGDEIGLWQVDEQAESVRSAPLASWNEKQPVSWYSLESNHQQEGVTLTANLRRPKYARTVIPRSMAEFGVLLQDGNIVGWTFGPWLDTGYFWAGDGGDGLRATSTLAGFYGATFANGREEAFARAIALENGPPFEQVSAFAQAFRTPAKLSAINTPHHLRPEAVIKQLRVQVARLRQHPASDAQLLKLFPPQVLEEIGDIGLFMDLIPVHERAMGHGAAIEAIESTGSRIVKKTGLNVPSLNEIHLRLYQAWLQAMVDSGDSRGGQDVLGRALRYYPDDPYIHLLRVDLEIQNGNWKEAERLLRLMRYPPELLDRRELLARRISEVKGQEGKIAIDFSPGSNRIPVAATINGAVRQEFLVDTGASMVTIPSSTVAELGLEIVQGYHGDKRTVSTAGGVTTASEVIIDSIEIGGWTETNIRALVLDIPDQPGLGLLGLNYLGRFQMDLNSDAGLLLLTPK